MSKTMEGWRKFQERHGLVEDGIPGHRTLRAVREMEDDLQHVWERVNLGVKPEPKAYSYGGEPMKKGIDRDPANLLPGFADKVELLFQEMRVWGYDPILWEGRRSFERAESLERKGTGIAKSMHCYGAAVDILDEDEMWGAPDSFWRALRGVAAQMGLYTIGLRDRAHVQGVHPSFSMQNEFRAMSDSKRREFVK